MCFISHSKLKKCTQPCIAVNQNNCFSNNKLRNDCTPVSTHRLDPSIHKGKKSSLFFCIIHYTEDVTKWLGSYTKHLLSHNLLI